MTKKISCGLLLILASAFTQALELPLQDANLKHCVQALVAKKNWQSLADITAIECHSKNITSLAGIEHFPQLQKLSLYNNQLTEASIGNLAQLRHINLAKNKIAQVNFSELPALQELYLFGNKMTALDLSGLPHLKLLKINDNKIVQFTYKDLPSLEKIYMFNNVMEHVDIYHLPAMTYMDARQNPMPDPLYEEMDKLNGVTFLHDGNAEDWQ
jgi:protein phosphatase 1 regulatory subunit 7